MALKREKISKNQKFKGTEGRQAHSEKRRDISKARKNVSVAEEAGIAHHAGVVPHRPEESDEVGVFPLIP